MKKKMKTTILPQDDSEPVNSTFDVFDLLFVAFI